MAASEPKAGAVANAPEENPINDGEAAKFREMARLMAIRRGSVMPAGGLQDLPEDMQPRYTVDSRRPSAAMMDVSDLDREHDPQPSRDESTKKDPSINKPIASMTKDESNTYRNLSQELKMKRGSMAPVGSMSSQMSTYGSQSPNSAGSTNKSNRNAADGKNKGKPVVYLEAKMQIRGKGNITLNLSSDDVPVDTAPVVSQSGNEAMEDNLPDVSDTQNFEISGAVAPPVTRHTSAKPNITFVGSDASRVLNAKQSKTGGDAGILKKRA